MKINKILSLALAAAMILSMAVAPAFAASTTANSTENVETETYTDHVDGTETVTVNATVASTYTVTIPKTITMAGAKDASTASYTVTVSGDIADDETVKVAPVDTTFQMTTKKGDKTATATIQQSKTEWKFNEFADQATGTITAPLTAGQWNGSFNFNISLEAPIETISFAIDGTPYQAQKNMTWEQWVNSEYNTGGFITDNNYVGITLDGYNYRYISKEINSAPIAANRILKNEAILEGHEYGMKAD